MRPLGALLHASQSSPRPRLVAPAPIGSAGNRYGLGARSGASPFNQTEQLSAMTTIGTLFAIIDRQASTTAATTWHLYKRARSGLKKDRREVFNHPALTVWNKPNPFYTQAEFIEATIQHYDLTGEYWWLIGRSDLLGPDSMPVELWVVRPDRMRPVPNPKAFVSGYVYRSGADEVPLRLADVIMNKRQNPADPYRGISPLASLGIDIRGELAAASYNQAFFDNAAEPGGIIKVPKELDDREFDQLVRRWREQHQGVHNAHRVAVLEVGEFQPLGYTRRDMQFIELRKFSRDAIRQAYGYPKPLLGDVDDINRANAEAAEAVFARWIVNPRNDRLRASLNHDFLPLFGDLAAGYEFDYDSAVPESREDVRAERGSKVQAVAQLVAAGFDPEKSLAAMELPSIPYVGKAALEAAPEPEGDEPASDPQTTPTPTVPDDPADDEEDDDGA